MYIMCCDIVNSYMSLQNVPHSPMQVTPDSETPAQWKHLYRRPHQEPRVYSLGVGESLHR